MTPLHRTLRGVCLFAALMVASACSVGNTLSITERRGLVDDAAGPTAGKPTFPCLAATKVVAGVEYTCADGEKRTGEFLAESLPACGQDGETGCVSNANYPAVEKSLVTPGVIQAGITLAGVSGTLTFEGPANCARDGETGCVSTESFPAVEKAKLAPGVLQFGVTVAGISGTLTSAGPGECVGDGEVACVSTTNFPAASAAGLASKVLSGQTVAGVAGNVTLPAAASVLASASFGVGGTGTTGEIATCSLVGRTGCYAGVGWTGVESADLTAANIRSGFSLGGVAGGYPSATHRLAGADATTDLTSLAASTAAGSYEFFDSAGTRYTGSVTDAGSIVVGTTNQTFNTSLYRGFTVPGDANLVAGSIRSGVTVFGVSGNVTLPSGSAVRSGTNYGIGGTGSSGTLANCSSEGGSDCVVDGASSYRAASTTGLASKVLSTASVAAVTGNVVLPAAADVKQNITYGVNGTGLTGSFTGSAVSDCTADGQSDCKIPASGTLKAADTANFTGWDIRKKRSQSTGAVLTFAGISSQAKSHCRNQARTALWDNYSGGTAPSAESHSSHAIVGLDFFDTIDDYNDNSTGLPSQIPAWTVINSTNYGADNACGGIFATGDTATGNSGADASMAHDANGNWQDLTPGTLPGGANSTNTNNGCNATDKHCVFKELISGLMVTEVSASYYNWANAINYCQTLGEAGNPVAALRSPIPVIGGTTHADWRLPTQKELLHISNAGVRGLNQTATLTNFFGDLDGSFGSSSSESFGTNYAWYVSLSQGRTSASSKLIQYNIVCVR